ncbi:hypothetical protein ACVLD2_002948 [Paenibacillus sp. PvR052]|nr:hypothetical protein [Paenibacillus sp. PvP091]MBP1168270.1 hypothetical protein [Paenibacillus sp. PvR098]MBP2439298.1 hypothetical protein [Paenibacillus sp. PvP052]
MIKFFTSFIDYFAEVKTETYRLLDQHGLSDHD